MVQQVRLHAPNAGMQVQSLVRELDPKTKTQSSQTKNKINKGSTLSDINHSKILYDPPPIVMEIKAKINKWNLIQL